MRSDEFSSQLDRKRKTWFFTFLNVNISWIERDNILLSQLSPANFRYFTDQNGPKRGFHENEFWHSEIQIWISETVWAQKVDEKNGVICLVFMSLSWVMVLKLPKIVHFLQNCVDLSIKSKSIKAIYLYPSERPHQALSENRCFIGV